MCFNGDVLFVVSTENALLFVFVCRAVCLSSTSTSATTTYRRTTPCNNKEVVVAGPVLLFPSLPL